MPKRNKPKLVVTLPVEWREEPGYVENREILEMDGIVIARVYLDTLAWWARPEHTGHATTPALARSAVERALGVREVKRATSK